jgi:DNA-binding NarL/FixJ family response regulator
MKRARIVVADDHVLTQQGIRSILEPHHEVMEMATDGQALIDASSRLLPDLIVTDIRMPLSNGIDATIQIKKRLPGVKVVFVTMQSDPAYVEAALNAGADGYVLKSFARDELLNAIQSVLNGRLFVSPSLSTEL